MSKIESDYLFLLIQSMSAAEKRFFKINALKNSKNDGANFIQLFEYLTQISNDKEVDYSNLKFCKKGQISNLKAHLYSKILESLRQIPSQQTIDILLRDEINNAIVLYNKGLYPQSLKILKKAKTKAIKYDEHALHFEINKLEKIIESQYITRSSKNRAEELIQDSIILSERTKRENDLSNLTLWLYNYLLRTGYANTEDEKAKIKLKVDAVLDNIDLKPLAFIEKMWWFKVKVWENLVMRSRKVEEASRDWVEHFYANEPMIRLHPVWFIRGNHYLLQAFFNNYNRKEFDAYYLRFTQVISKENFPINPNIRNLIFIYKNTALLNQDFLHFNYNNTHQWQKVLHEAKDYEDVIDSHYLNIIKFKCAALFFISREYESSQHVLYSIVNLNTAKEKDDLYFYTQILLLMNYYDGGDDGDVEQVLSKLYKLIDKNKFFGDFYKKLVQMFEDIFNASPLNIKLIFDRNRKQLMQLKEDPDYRKSQRYLNFYIWFESHITNLDVADLLRENMRKKLIV